MHILKCDDSQRYSYKKGCNGSDWGYYLLVDNGTYILEVTQICYCDLMTKFSKYKIQNGVGSVLIKSIGVNDKNEFNIKEGSTLNFIITDMDRSFVFLPYEIKCLLLFDKMETVELIYDRSPTPKLKLKSNNISIIKTLTKELKSHL